MIKMQGLNLTNVMKIAFYQNKLLKQRRNNKLMDNY